MVEHADPAWIALSSPDLVAGMAAVGASGRLRVVAEASTFGALLATGRPHVAILVAPPATDADETLVLRERARRSGLRIVHVTRPEDVDRRVDALRRGFDEALTTGIDPDELLCRLQILDTRARARRGTELSAWPGLVLDPIAHEVRRDGELVHLRPKEFQLLTMLASHPGRAYTRRQLLDRVWGSGHQGDPRTVDVHVRWLRAKLEPSPATPVHLITVRGIGYRLDPESR